MNQKGNEKKIQFMEEYLIGKKEKGIFRIYNLKTDKSYFGITKDIIKTRAEERFMLDLGLHKCKALQEDYKTTGLELFVIDLVKIANEEDDLDALLSETIAEFTAKGITLYQA